MSERDKIIERLLTEGGISIDEADSLSSTSSNGYIAFISHPGFNITIS
jgi:hypothetical protein